MVGEGLYTHILYTYIRHRVRIGGGKESGGSMKEDEGSGESMKEDAWKKGGKRRMEESGETACIEECDSHNIAVIAVVFVW